MPKDSLEEIIAVIQELCEDTTLPKNIKIKFQEITNSLKQKGEKSIKVNKALSDLDEIADDSNLQPFVRTQIWNIVSMLEKVA